MNVRNLSFSNSQHTKIYCEIEHTVYGWIPFNATIDDTEAYGRDVFKRAISGEFGHIADYILPPKEKLAALARQERDRLLGACDWTQLPDAQLSVEKKAAWAAYRQALRDITSQPEFPQSIEWPTRP